MDDHDNWYAEAMGQTLGPMSRQRLIELVQSGTMAGDDDVHQGDPRQATPCRRIPFLARWLKVGAPTPKTHPPAVSQPGETATQPSAATNTQQSRGPSTRSPDTMLDRLESVDESELPSAAATPSVEDIMDEVLLSEPVVRLRPREKQPEPPVTVSRQDVIENVLPPIGKIAPRTSVRGPGLSINRQRIGVGLAVSGIIAVLYFAFTVLFSGAVDRPWVIDQVWRYCEEIKYARSSNDREQLQRLAERVESETREIVNILTQVTHDGADGHKADQTLLYLIRDALPEAINAPVTDEAALANVERHIQIAKDAL